MIKWPWKEKVAPAPLPWQQALSAPIFASLQPDEEQALVQLAQRFLHHKRLVPLAGLELEALHHARIALLFCLPVLKLGLEWLDGFHEVLIYPAPFVAEDSWQDEDGLVHSDRSVQSGQSWQQGPIILNWIDIQDSFDLSGFNLIIHEVAHKLDARGSGYTNGVPAIPLREVAGWELELHAAMEAIQEEVDLVGENAATIDAYAATDPAECFAVLSEYFFSAPELLAQRFSGFYQRLTRFYRQDPLARLRPLAVPQPEDRPQA
ncbi:DgsA anti-repressor MtfA [Mixta tenebrionis]|uniref:Mlc titration factor A n=1 Tax=Mixta tenebrionis TaxID=2562439 RepID=A0A506UZK0_9GAMM|nr:MULTISPECIES: DgsA anti-repressor MtfA [Mixta]QHM75069.1 Protein MtfA [Mixta theicola]TPW38726.1 DgsA anti-repressor MtfA [Mixta tenebrionis]